MDKPFPQCTFPGELLPSLFPLMQNGNYQEGLQTQTPVPFRDGNEMQEYSLFLTNQNQVVKACNRINACSDRVSIRNLSLQDELDKSVMIPLESLSLESAKNSDRQRGKVTEVPFKHTIQAPVFANLPLEVSTQIISQLSLEEIARAMAVCRHWRWCILRWASLWREIRIYRPRGSRAKLIAPLYQTSLAEWYLRNVNPEWLQELAITNLHSTKMKTLVDSLCSHKQIRVTKLSLTDDGLVSSVIDLDTFRRLLNCVGNSLISVEYTGIRLSLGSLIKETLQRCPQLIQLKHSHPFSFHINDYTVVYPRLPWNFLSNQQYHSLKTLTLKIDATRLTSFLMKLLQACPNLAHLWIYHIIGDTFISETLDAIATCSPCIETVAIYTGINYRWNQDIPSTDICKGIGMRQIVLRGCHREDYDTNLANLIRKYHSSLEHLELSTVAFHLTESWATLSQLSAPNLHTLIVKTNDSFATESLGLLGSVIAKSPVLRVVHFENMHPLPSTVTNAICNVVTLVELSIVDCSVSTHSADWLVNVIEASNNLEKLHLENMACVKGTVLASINRSPTLRHVTLTSCAYIWDRDILSFVANLRPSLEQVSFIRCTSLSRNITLSIQAILRSSPVKTPKISVHF